jgi:hypothetical protein
MSEIVVRLGDIRVTSTVDLMQLYVDAKKLEFRRNLPDGIASNLDPHGNHVLTLVLTGHQAKPPHHRASVLVKLRDSGRPFCAFLDVAAETWLKLFTTDEAKDHPQDTQHRLMLPSRLVAELESVK